MDHGHSDEVLNLLFTLNEWMAFAKLQLHTETTLLQFESSTALLGREMRRFKDVVCSKYPTIELPREEAARRRRNAASAAAGQPLKEPRTSGKLSRSLNLNTYKFHALGDYPATIRHFGTTDSYSTQVVHSKFCSYVINDKNLRYYYGPG